VQDNAQQLRLGQRGDSPNPGLQLVTVVTLPEFAFRGQLVYLLDLDEFRVFDGDAWQIPTAANNGGSQTFVSPTQPVADAVGDLWMRTTDLTLHVWDGTLWKQIIDPNANAAAAAAASALAAAADALDIAENAQAIADGKVEIFYTTLAPEEPDFSPKAGDIWYRTSDNRAFRRVGASWVEIVDAAITQALTAANTAQATADQKITTYYSDEPPWPNETPGHGNDIGDLWFDTNNENKPYRWNGNWVSVQDGGILLARDIASTALENAAAAQAQLDEVLVEIGTDGVPPLSSPTPILTPSIKTFMVRVTPVANVDPVIYDYHVSTDPNLGSIYDASTLLLSTNAWMTTVYGLPGPDPDPGEPDERILQPEVTYYVLVQARDGDGAAPPSEVASIVLKKITGPDVAAETFTGEHFVGGSFTGREFAGEIITATDFKTGSVGQRTIWGRSGIQQYTQDEKLTVNMPSDGSVNMIDAEIVARGLTAKEGIAMEGESEVKAGAKIVLSSGISAPTTSPQMINYWETVRPNFSPQLGPLGAFNLVPGEVMHVHWNAAESMFNIFQFRANGTRLWRCDTSGNPGTFTADDDFVNWEICGQTVIASGSKAGTYRMQRYLPQGNAWYVDGPPGLNQFTRTNVNRRPMVGNNGTDLFIAETLANNSVQVTYRNMNPHGATISAPTSTFTSAASIFGASLVSAERGNFDVAADRYAFSERYFNYNSKMFSISGSTLTNVAGHSWEIPITRLGQAWDGTRFWTYGNDGLFYKHTSTVWDPASTSSVLWAKSSYYDSVGTTHETDLGPVRKLPLAARRAITRVVLPEIQGAGGVDEPNANRLYMARGATQPADSSFKLQYSGATLVVDLTSISGAGATHTTTPFPDSTPGWMENSAGTLELSGDGRATFVSVTETEAKPHSYARYLTSAGLATSTTTYVTLTGWTVQESSSITYSSGVWTCPVAGRYRIAAAVSYATNNAGLRGIRFLIEGTGRQTILIGASPALHTTVAFSPTFRLSASGTIAIQGIQSSGGTLNVNGDTDGAYTNCWIEYVGP